MPYCFNCTLVDIKKWCLWFCLVIYSLIVFSSASQSPKKFQASFESKPSLDISGVFSFTTLLPLRTHTCSHTLYFQQYSQKHLQLASWSDGRRQCSISVFITFIFCRTRESRGEWEGCRCKENEASESWELLNLWWHQGGGSPHLHLPPCNKTPKFGQSTELQARQGSTVKWVALTEAACEKVIITLLLRPPSGPPPSHKAAMLDLGSWGSGPVMQQISHLRGISSTCRSIKHFYPAQLLGLEGGRSRIVNICCPLPDRTLT